MGRTACTEPQCLYSTAIPLLLLWAVRPVQSLSACKVQLYLYSPMDRKACTEPQCLYSTAIPLLPLWAVRPVQSLSACTVQLYLYSPLWAVQPVQSLSACTVELHLYSPHMGRKACTEPQCLHSTAIPLLPPYGPYGLYRASVPAQYSYTSTPPYGP